mmetsp:Transcript_8864/g.9378  ORF Transcript_8864/g.9378 Transcript_8864/m.9378 type:complete len:222 (-) Transcript_8864:98-763(-)
MEFLRQQIDELKQKINQLEESRRNEPNPAQRDLLKEDIERNEVTLRGLYQLASTQPPPPRAQPAPAPQVGQNVGVPQVETAHSEGYSNYSPMSFSGYATPRSRSAANLHDDEFVHYTKLLKSALKKISPDFTIKFSQGNLLIIHQRMPFVKIPSVSTSLHLKNIYYLIKVMREEPYSWNEYIRINGIPTLVQATMTGSTPSTIDDDFNLSEFDPRMFQFGS